MKTAKPDLPVVISRNEGRTSPPLEGTVERRRSEPSRLSAGGKLLAFLLVLLVTRLLRAQGMPHAQSAPAMLLLAQRTGLSLPYVWLLRLFNRSAKR